VSEKVQEEITCGFCVNETPRDLMTGWRGWFICGECVELLAEVRAQTNIEARERLIAKLTKLRDEPPTAWFGSSLA
jgi:hypothetical protein